MSNSLSEHLIMEGNIERCSTKIWNENGITGTYIKNSRYFPAMYSVRDNFKRFPLRGQSSSVHRVFDERVQQKALGYLAESIGLAPYQLLALRKAYMLLKGAGTHFNFHVSVGTENNIAEMKYNQAIDCKTVGFKLLRGKIVLTVASYISKVFGETSLRNLNCCPRKEDNQLLLKFILKLSTVDCTLSRATWWKSVNLILIQGNFFFLLTRGKIIEENFKPPKYLFYTTLLKEMRN